MQLKYAFPFSERPDQPPLQSASSEQKREGDVSALDYPENNILLEFSNTPSLDVWQTIELPPDGMSPRRSSIQTMQSNKTPTATFGDQAMPSVQNPEDKSYDIILQPETRPISQEQLEAEVKGIYAGLVMVEAKCIEVDNKQAELALADPGSQPKLNNEQWQALIALHRTLLQEHHDFFLASPLQQLCAVWLRNMLCQHACGAMGFIVSNWKQVSCSR
jgi:hypothetical protein